MQDGLGCEESFLLASFPSVGIQARCVTLIAPPGYPRVGKAHHMAKGDRWSDDRDVKVREMRNAETILETIVNVADEGCRDSGIRSLESYLRSKDSRVVRRGAVGKVP